jgi:hypothetical protein
VESRFEDRTGWVGFIVFAGIMLVLLGSLDFIYGMTAIIKDDYFQLTRQGLLVFDLTAWGWITLIFGVIEFLAGLAIIAGATWGRVFGVIIAGLSVIHQFTLMSANPIWSLLIISLNVLVIWALVVHGREMKY